MHVGAFGGGQFACPTQVQSLPEAQELCTRTRARTPSPRWPRPRQSPGGSRRPRRGHQYPAKGRSLRRSRTVCLVDLRRVDCGKRRLGPRVAVAHRRRGARLRLCTRAPPRQALGARPCRARRAQEIRNPSAGQAARILAVRRQARAQRDHSRRDTGRMVNAALQSALRVALAATEAPRTLRTRHPRRTPSTPCSSSRWRTRRTRSCRMAGRRPSTPASPGGCRRSRRSAGIPRRSRATSRWSRKRRAIRAVVSSTPATVTGAR